jgi:hypothetical protein
MMNNCERCDLYPRYQHPQTGKIYKLCASCAWETLTRSFGLIDNEEMSDQKKVDEVVRNITYESWAYGRKDE